MEVSKKNMVCAACYALCRVLVEAEGLLLQLPRKIGHIYSLGLLQSGWNACHAACSRCGVVLSPLLHNAEVDASLAYFDTIIVLWSSCSFNGRLAAHMK
jgi:hypothetical protein